MEFVNNSILIKQGAEAKIYKGSYLGAPAIFKLRFSKAYRHPKLDESLTKERIRAEARALLKCRTIGVHVPAVYCVDFQTSCIVLEWIEDSKCVRECVNELQRDSIADGATSKLNEIMKTIGTTVAALHRSNVIHGDLTTSNMLLIDSSELVLIDFGLSYVDPKAEDKAVDLYVLERAFLSTHPDTQDLFAVVLQAYRRAAGSGDVLKKLDEVRSRGRKRTMIG